LSRHLHGNGWAEFALASTLLRSLGDMPFLKRLQRRFDIVHTTHRFTVIVIAFVLSLAGCGGSEPPEKGLVEDLGTLMPGEPVTPDAAEAAPQNVEVLFADDLVHVSRIALQPGETVPEIESNHRVYYHPNGDVELAMDRDDEVSSIEIPAGDVHYLEPGVVTISNAGLQAARLVEVARTDVMLPEFMEDDRPAASEGILTLFANDVVEVRQVTLDAGESADLPLAPIRVVYTDSSAMISYRDADGVEFEVSLEGASAHQRPGNDAAVTNLADDPVTLVLFDWLV
jgi:hypothetical protein